MATRLFVLAFLSVPFLIQAQESNFSPKVWKVIENRWRESQPVTVVYTNSGQVIAGQQMHASADSLYICGREGLPVGTNWTDELVPVPVNEIDYVLFQKGGNPLGRDKRASTLDFPSSNARYSEPHVQLRKASVYADSLVYPPDLESALSYSKVLKQAFPQKRVRYSLGVNFGRDVVIDEIQKTIEGSPLASSYESYGGHVNLEFLDLSFRLFDRLIIGGSLFSRRSYTTLYGSDSNELRQISYDYSIDFVEHRVYTEYAILHTDRYFSRNIELIAGAGLLLGKPEWRLFYDFFNIQDPDNNYQGYPYYSHNDLLLGLQLKGAFHYYFFPGMSIWTALDVNLNQPFVVPEQELPTSLNQDPLILSEHELGFSSVRFKLGLSIYL